MIDTVRRELRDGRKRSHWMWFVFPQVRGLGRSAMAQRYAIGSLAEAAAYLQHHVLEARLVECTGLVNALQGRSATAIFGSPDDVKFRSCMTLFARVAEAPPVFAEALRLYFDGAPDRATLAKLGETAD